MQHATALDALNAAWGLTHQVAGTITKQQEYELDAELFKQSIMREKLDKELIADLTRVDESGENPFQQHPEAYEKHVQARLAEWRRNAAAAGNGSPYYMDRLNRMDAMGNEAMRQQAAAHKDNVTRQRTDIAYAKADAEIKNAGAGIQETLAGRMINLNLRNSKNAANTVDKYKEMTRFANEGLSQALNIDIKNKSIQEVYDEIDAKLTKLEEAWVPYLGEGESLDGLLEGKQEKIANTQLAAKKAIWQRDFDYGARLNAEYQRIARDAIKENNPELKSKMTQQALYLWQQGSRLRDAALANLKSARENGGTPNYAPKDGDTIADWFPLIAGLQEGSGGGSGSSDTEIRNLRQYRIEGIANGAWTHEEGKALFAEDVGKLAAAFGNTDAFDKRYASATDFSGFWRDAKEYLLKENPAYQAAFDVLDKLVKPWQEKAPKGEGALRQLQGKLLGMYLFDALTDKPGAARMTPEQLAQEAERVAGHVIGGKISFLREAEYQGGVSEGKFAEALKERAEHPWARIVIGHGVNAEGHNFGSEKYEQEFTDRAKEFLRKIANVPLSSITHGHGKEGEYDETAELTFQITGQGDKNGNYRFGSDGKKYWVEEMVGGEWVSSERLKGTAGEAGTEARKQKEAEHGEIRRQADVSNSVKLIKDQENPDTRIALAAELLQRNEGTLGGIQKTEKELWRKGIDPYYGDVYEAREDGLYMNGDKVSAAEIPALMWEALLDGNPALQRPRTGKGGFRITVSASGEVYEVKRDGLYVNGKKATEIPAPMWEAMLDGMAPAKKEAPRKRGVNHNTRGGK